MFFCFVFLLDVSLDTARSFELILQEIGVVRGGDEVVAERPAHVLVDVLVAGVEDQTVLLVQVHEEAVLGEQLL